MNWVGGIRNRLKSKNELKQQKEYFERKRFEAKVKRVKPTTAEKSHGVSMDLISFNALTKKNNDAWSDGKKENQGKIRKVDLGEPRTKNRAIRDLELPVSPCKQNSKLHFMDTKESSRLEKNSLVSARKVANFYDLDMEPSSVELSLEYERKRKQRRQMRHNQGPTITNLDFDNTNFEQFVTPASRIIKRFNLPTENRKERAKEITNPASNFLSKSTFPKEHKRQITGGKEVERSFSPPSSDMFFNLKKKRDLYSKEFRKNVYQSEDFQKTPIKKYSVRHLQHRKPLAVKKHENINISEQKANQEKEIHFNNSLQPIKEIEIANDDDDISYWSERRQFRKSNISVSPRDILDDADYNRMRPTILKYSPLLPEHPVGSQPHISPDISTIEWNKSCTSILSSTDLQSTASITSSAFSEESPFKCYTNENQGNIDSFTDVSQQMFEPSPDSESQIYMTKLSDLLKNGPKRVQFDQKPVDTPATDSDSTSRQASTCISYNLNEREDSARTEKIVKEGTTKCPSLNTPAVVKKQKMGDAEEVFVELLHLDEEDKRIDDVDFQMAEEKDLQDFERKKWFLDADQEVPEGNELGFLGVETLDTESHSSLVDTTPERGVIYRILADNGQPQPSNSLQCLMEELLEKLSTETGHTLQLPCDVGHLHTDDTDKFANKINLNGKNENGQSNQKVKSQNKKEFWTQTSPFLISITSANNCSEFIDSKLIPSLPILEEDIIRSDTDNISKTQMKFKETSVQCSLLPNNEPLDQMQGIEKTFKTQGVQTNTVVPRPTHDSSTSPMIAAKNEIETQTETKLCPFCAIEFEESTLELSRSNSKDKNLLLENPSNKRPSIKTKNVNNLGHIADHQHNHISKSSLTSNYDSTNTLEKFKEKNDRVGAHNFSSYFQYEVPKKEAVLPHEKVEEESVLIQKEGPNTAKVSSSEVGRELNSGDEHILNSPSNSGTSTLSNYNTADSQTSENCT